MKNYFSDLGTITGTGEVITEKEIIKVLKDYEDKKILIAFVKLELKRLVLEFRKAW